MACRECQERREAVIDAVLQGRLLSAAGHVAAGAVEMVKPKPRKTAKAAKTED